MWWCFWTWPTSEAGSSRLFVIQQSRGRSDFSFTPSRLKQLGLSYINTGWIWVAGCHLGRGRAESKSESGPEKWENVHLFAAMIAAEWYTIRREIAEAVKDVRYINHMARCTSAEVNPCTSLHCTLRGETSWLSQGRQDTVMCLRQSLNKNRSRLRNWRNTHSRGAKKERIWRKICTVWMPLTPPIFKGSAGGLCTWLK